MIWLPVTKVDMNLKYKYEQSPLQLVDNSDSSASCHWIDS